MSSIKEKLKAVSTAIAAIEKRFGKGAIMPLGGGEVAEIGVIPTGSVGLDLALGVGWSRRCERRGRNDGERGRKRIWWTSSR